MTISYEDRLNRLKREKCQHATEMAGMWLHRANLAAERGEKAKAEQMYARSQKWHDRMNDLLGNGEVV